MKKLIFIAALLVGGNVTAGPWLIYDTTATATGQNIRMASGANASGEYGVVVGTNAAVTDSTPVFAVCEDCDNTTPVYVWTLTAAGNWTLDATVPLITTASSAAGLNFGLASGANAGTEYGVVVGTTAAASALVNLFGVASDVDGTPVYALTVENIAADGGGANVYNTASAAGINLTLASGANAAGEYGVTLGTNAPNAALDLVALATDIDGTPGVAASFTSLASSVGGEWHSTSSTTGLNIAIASGANAAGEYGVLIGSDATGLAVVPLAAFAQDIDGTPNVHLTISTGVANAVSLGTENSAAGQNLTIASGANAAGEYAVDVGSNAVVSDGTQLLGVCSDCDGTEVYVFTVSADGNVLLDASVPFISTTSSSAGVNLTLASAAAGPTEYGVTVGSNVVASDTTPLFSVASDIDGTPAHVFTVQADGDVLTTGDVTATLGAGEVVTFNKTATDATAENGLVLNYTALDTTSGTTAQYGLYLNNVASTEGADALLVLNNADADDAVVTGIKFLNPTRFTTAIDTANANINAGTGTVTASTFDGSGAVALTIGSADITSLTVTTDGTGDGEVVLPGSSVSAGEIVDITRSVPLPVGGGWLQSGLTALDPAGATSPKFVAINSGLAIEYDADGGAVDTTQIVMSFPVPADYASGGAFVARVTQGAATVTNIETWSCDVSLDGAALVGANAANLTNQTAVQTATSTPVVTYAAGNAVAVLCRQGNSSADDVVNIHSIEWQYTATQ